MEAFAFIYGYTELVVFNNSQIYASRIYMQTTGSASL